MASRRALVTGGSSGLGTAIAARLLSEGYRVVVTGRDLARLHDALPPRGDSSLGFVVADLATDAGCAAALAGALAFLGGLDVLVNNAGAGVIGQQLGQASMEAFDAVFALNVRAPFLLTQLRCRTSRRAASSSTCPRWPRSAPFRAWGPTARQRRRWTC